MYVESSAWQGEGWKSPRGIFAAQSKQVQCLSITLLFSWAGRLAVCAVGA